MSKIDACLQDLSARLQSIAELKNRVHVVYSPEKLVRVIKGAVGAQIGVVYEGMTGLQELGKTQKGVAKSAQFGLYLAFPTAAGLDNLQSEASSILMLDKIGAELEGKSAPTGHFWEFVAESYADSFPDRALWVQRWSTKVVSR